MRNLDVSRYNSKQSPSGKAILQTSKALLTPSVTIVFVSPTTPTKKHRQTISPSMKSSIVFCVARSSKNTRRTSLIRVA